MSKYTLFFEKFANRHLARWELDVIATLEYTRQHNDNHRIVIIDLTRADSCANIISIFTTVSTTMAISS